MPRRPVAGPSSGRRGSDTLNSGAVLDFTPLAKSQEQLAGVDSLQMVEFELTPRMSPYLLAVAVGRLEQLEGAGGAAKDVTLSGTGADACAGAGAGTNSRKTLNEVLRCCCTRVLLVLPDASSEPPRW